jgi:S-adenosylmethionine/arginine decarboxylase-like enzyme
VLIRPDGYIGHIAIHNVAETTRAAVQVMTPPSTTSAPSKQS